MIQIKIIMNDLSGKFRILSGKCQGILFSMEWQPCRIVIFGMQVDNNLLFHGIEGVVGWCDGAG